MTWVSQLWNVVVEAVLPDAGFVARVEIPEREAAQQEVREAAAAAAAAAAARGEVSGGERD